jgi:hypothetical protein
MLPPKIPISRSLGLPLHGSCSSVATISFLGLRHTSATEELGNRSFKECNPDNDLCVTMAAKPVEEFTADVSAASPDEQLGCWA